jgi:hypothetical protein
MFYDKRNSDIIGIHHIPSCMHLAKLHASNIAVYYFLLITTIIIHTNARNNVLRYGQSDHKRKKGFICI